MKTAIALLFFVIASVAGCAEPEPAEFDQFAVCPEDTPPALLTCTCFEGGSGCPECKVECGTWTIYDLPCEEVTCCNLGAPICGLLLTPCCANGVCSVGSCVCGICQPDES